MNANAYINIPYFLRGKLDLKGSELIISALIYGFSQDGETWFTGNTAYICQWTGTEKKNVLRCLSSLVDKGIIIKKEVRMNNGAKRCYYQFNLADPRLQKDTDPRLQKDTAYNINEDIISDDNINGDNIGKGENEFSPASSLSTKIKFSRENGLTPANLNVRQSTIDKIDSAFEQLIFPIDDLEIKRLYFVLCCSPKWRNKTVHAMQISLNKVQNYDKEFTKKLIEDSIAGGWQGLVFEDTDKKYQNYLKSKKGGIDLGGGVTFTKMSDEERKDAEWYLNLY